MLTEWIGFFDMSRRRCLAEYTSFGNIEPFDCPDDVLVGSPATECKLETER